MFKLNKGIWSILIAVAVIFSFMIPAGLSMAAGPVNVHCVGSTTVYPIAQQSESLFETAYPDIDLTLEAAPGSGSSNGFNTVLADGCDVGMASRSPKAGDETNKVDAWQIAKDAVCIIVKNSSNMAFLTNVTKAQLETIYEAETGITSLYWDDPSLGFSGAPHQLVVPRARIIGSGTRSSFHELVPVEEDKEEVTISTLGLDRLDGNPDVVDAIKANDYQIGYCGLGFISDSGVRAVMVESVTPSVSTVLNGSYPMSRSLYMMTLKPQYDPTYKLQSLDYINWVLSDAGQNIVEAKGFVRVNPVAPYWDINEDGQCNISDFVMMGNKWQMTGSVPWAREDLNSDGIVNVSDFVILGNHWQETW